MKKMKFKAIELKYLDEETIKNIRIWRNQKFIADQMFTQHEIGEEEHQRWVDAVRKDENRHLFVFYLDDQPFAVVQSRYDPKHDYVETGDYLISEEYQVMGYGTFVKYFIPVIMFHHLGYKTIYGEILNNNKNNIRILNKLCKDDLRVEERLIDGKKVEVCILEVSIKSGDKDNSDHLEKLIHKCVEKEYEILI